ncbi:MAG TPA: hypothetical protein VFK84_01685 [Burkholderiales bacterium]|nr:hypothetical protein [Burkholderiales bacterium]
MKHALLAALLLAGCAAVDHHFIASQPITNDRGHVIGQKELLSDARTGELTERVTLFTPRLDAHGNVAGYEEALPSGTVLRGLDGKRVGVRYTDLRSRGTNPQSEPVTVILTP